MHRFYLERLDVSHSDDAESRHKNVCFQTLLRPIGCVRVSDKSIWLLFAILTTPQLVTSERYQALGAAESWVWSLQFRHSICPILPMRVPSHGWQCVILDCR